MVSSAKPVHTVTNMPMFFFSTFIGLAGASHITANCKVSHGACAQDSLHQGSPSWLHHSDLKTLECESCQIDLFGCFFHRKMPASESHHPMFWTQAMDIRPKNVKKVFEICSKLYPVAILLLRVKRGSFTNPKPRPCFPRTFCVGRSSMAGKQIACWPLCGSGEAGLLYQIARSGSVFNVSIWGPGGCNLCPRKVRRYACNARVKGSEEIQRSARRVSTSGVRSFYKSQRSSVARVTPDLRICNLRPPKVRMLTMISYKGRALRV